MATNRSCRFARNSCVDEFRNWVSSLKFWTEGRPRVEEIRLPFLIQFPPWKPLGRQWPGLVW